MFRYIIINESQLEIVKTIVKSSDELIRIIKEQPKLDKIISNTITQILLLMAKIIHCLPEILLTGNGNRVLKHELTASYARALNCWSSFSENQDDFINAWLEFVFWWQEYCRLAEVIKNENPTLFISVN